MHWRVMLSHKETVSRITDADEAFKIGLLDFVVPIEPASISRKCSMDHGNGLFVGKNSLVSLDSGVASHVIYGK